MEETGIGREQPLIAHDAAPKVSQPGTGPLDDPPPPIAPPLAPILMGGVRMGAPGGDDRLHAPPRQARPLRVALIAAIRDQSVGPRAGASRLPRAADRDRVQGLLEARDLRRGGRVQGLLPTEGPRHRPAPSPSCPCPAWWYQLWAPLFRGDKATINNACIPAELLSVIELG
jgi:hypothetical protein